jgi:GDPmannose 4,6-dehydratase
MNTQKKRALITGIYGQDGSYLAELLFSKGYEVHGIERDPLTENAKAVCEYLKNKGIPSFAMHNCDLNSYSTVRKLIEYLLPDECYHLAATHYSSEISDTYRRQTDRELFNNNVSSVINIIGAISEISRHTRLVIAGSCLMFEDSEQSPQNECTPYAASSMYGLSKLTAAKYLNYYRETYDLHLSVAIFYNHESPRRQETFIFKKIASNLCKVKNKEMNDFSIGDLNAVRDWGYAKDYVYGMWLMAQQNRPKDYILATGCGHSVKDILSCAADKLNIDYEKVVKTQSGLIDLPPKAILIGDPTLARTELGWKCSVGFEGLVDIMLSNEMDRKLD